MRCPECNSESVATVHCSSDYVCFKCHYAWCNPEEQAIKPGSIEAMRLPQDKLVQFMYVHDCFRNCPFYGVYDIRKKQQQKYTKAVRELEKFKSAYFNTIKHTVE